MCGSASPDSAWSPPHRNCSFAEDSDPDIAFIENVAGTLYLERKEDIAACDIAFEHLRTAAFSLPQSLDLILAAARSYEQ